MSQNQREGVPLCVDMDGTLVCTDMLQETLLLWLRQKPFGLLRLAPVIFKQGWPAFKKALFQEGPLPQIASLPFHEPLIDYLKQEKARGRTLIFVTASSQSIAEKVANHVGIFDLVLGSDAEVNLGGHKKAKKLNELYGRKGYVYAGNAAVDLKVWQDAAAAIVVHAPPALKEKAQKLGAIEAYFPHPTSGLRAFLRTMRINQWVKNVLIFAPAVLAHKLAWDFLFLKLVLSFFAFSLVSSSVYFINDLLDLESDRLHPDKKLRPLPAGHLLLSRAVAGFPLLLGGGLGLGFYLSSAFGLVLGGYFLLTLLYSLRLKQKAIIDVLVLSGLYSWRIFAGGVVAEIEISHWFLSFSSFFFLSLALMKRVAELRLIEILGKKTNKSREYVPEDSQLITAFGAASGFISILVFTLYLNSPEVKALYLFPNRLWLCEPFILYWLCRLWLKAQRGKMSSDPVVYAVKDPVSYLVILAVLLVLLISSVVV